MIAMLVTLSGPSLAGPQRDAVCGGSCGGDCGPCNPSSGASGASAPAQPSAWIRDRTERLEGRGVKAYDACIAEFARKQFDDAIDECRRSLETYIDAFGSATNDRGHEALRALAAAENARAVELFHRGRCSDAARLFESAAAHDSSSGMYARNATLFTASACAAAQHPHAAPPPPPPPPPSGVTSRPAILPSTGALAAARSAFQQSSPLVRDFAKSVAIDSKLVSTAELSKQYNELVRDLVNDATGAMTESVSILGGGDGSTSHVLDTPQHMAQRINQFVSDELVGIAWEKTRAWIAH